MSGTGTSKSWRIGVITRRPAAYLFQRFTNHSAPFSMFLHADMGLYEDQVYLRQKLLYADNIVVACDFNRQFLHDLYRDTSEDLEPKIYVHHLGLDLERVAYKPDGRLTSEDPGGRWFRKCKGFEYLLKAAHELTRRGVDYELELIGDGSQARQLRKLARELSVSDKVLFPGWLHSSDVQLAMERVTILVHPSNGVGDAVPTVIKEAMAVGTPVVASSYSARGDAAYSFRQQIRSASRTLSNGCSMYSDLRRKYADAARTYAEAKFDMRRNDARLAHLLSQTKIKTLQPVLDCHPER